LRVNIVPQRALPIAWSGSISKKMDHAKNSADRCANLLTQTSIGRSLFTPSMLAEARLLPIGMVPQLLNFGSSKLPTRIASGLSRPLGMLDRGQRTNVAVVLAFVGTGLVRKRITLKPQTEIA